MAEITKLESIVKKIKDFDDYLSQSIETVKVLNDSKTSIKQLEKELNQKIEIFNNHEINFLGIIEKSNKELESVEIKSDEILNHISEEKNALSALEEKLNNTIKETNTQINRHLGVQWDNLVQNINAKHVEIQKAVEINHQKLDKEITDFLQKQNALINNLNLQINSYKRVTESLKLEVEKQNKIIDELTNRFEKQEKEIERLNEDSKLCQQRTVNLEKETYKVIRFIRKLWVNPLNFVKFKK